MMIAEGCEDEVIAMKKRKLLLEPEENMPKKVFLELEQIKKFENLPKIIPVIGDEYFRNIETEQMFVGKVNRKKETSRLIKELSAFWPLTGRSHLKRVRWTQQKDIFEILIRPVERDESSQNYSLTTVLGKSNINTIGLMDCVAIHEVPKYPALTHHQYKEATKYWPVQFREDKCVEKALKDDLFNIEEKNRIATFTKMCMNVAQHGDEKIGCVIVDPVTSKVIAVAHDRRVSHPIQHAVMVAVDLVAKSQGGGSWNIESDHVYHMPFSQEEIYNTIAEIRKSNPGKDAKKMYLPYLCTGYDAYISREPCVMCAMALVHSRIRRVFYAHTYPRGALGSHCKLHLQEGLNHHYEVFRVELGNGQISSENSTEHLVLDVEVNTDCNSSS